MAKSQSSSIFNTVSYEPVSYNPTVYYTSNQAMVTFPAAEYRRPFTMDLDDRGTCV